MTSNSVTEAVMVPQEESFRTVLGHFASGVVAVTGIADDGYPTGLTVSSFTSVSLSPPLVSFCAALTSRTWPRLRGTGNVCVSILSEQQQDVSRQFARSGADKFRGVEWSRSPGGLPVLDGSLGWLECSVTAEHRAGDHLIVVLRVLRLAANGESGPLIHYRGGYGGFAGPREAGLPEGRPAPIW